METSFGALRRESDEFSPVVRAMAAAMPPRFRPAKSVSCGCALPELGELPFGTFGEAARLRKSLNQGIDHVVELLREMGKLPFAGNDSMQCAIVEIEEVRCDMNADFTKHLADSERFDEGHFWKQRRTFEKKWRDPDDVYIDVERREEERKEQGLPPRVIGSILPHSAVAQAEELWEAEQERKKTSREASEVTVNSDDTDDSEGTPRNGKAQ